MLLLPAGPIVAKPTTTTPLLDLWLFAAEDAETSWSIGASRLGGSGAAGDEVRAEGGLTDRDFQLAARIQELDQPTQPA
jgi:hypothetical protein